jgi:hypothetical protein
MRRDLDECRIDEVRTFLTLGSKILGYFPSVIRHQHFTPIGAAKVFISTLQTYQGQTEYTTKFQYNN